MLYIDTILVEDDIVSSNFICDLKNCKGACCTFPGEFGAPLLDEEVEILENIVPYVEDYLSKKSLSVIKNKGVVEGSKGNYTTVCINKRDCVFVYYEKDIALCSIERAYTEGRISFRKPISCHLYPIRVKKTTTDYLYYNRIEECEVAIRKGNSLHIKLVESLSEALIRNYGVEWYNKLSEHLKKKS